ncbi:hypothetical protein O181_059701, partial [Austropuccinia psidii MF-1]|nr:hypothetical protein [Austropuccinia psidii MF-1]
GACETLGEYNRAVDCYERALKLNPLNGTALTKAAGIYRHQENFKTAAKYFSRLLKMHEGNGEIWGALGHCYLMIDELPRTYTSYQQALHHCPSPKSEPKLWYGIGVLYDRYGSLEHAEEAFSSVIKMDPYFEKANEIYFRLGIIYKQQRKADLSLQCFQWILDKPPSPLTEIDIWFQIGHVHEQQGNFDRAKEAYERVLTENPTHAKVLQQLGGLYCREGASFYDPHEAIVILNRSRSVDSNDPFTWYLLGRVHMIIQDYHRAYESYQQAVYREGKNPAFWCSIGVLYYAISQFLDSLDAYSRAIRINPFLSEVWFNLGALYESCKDQMPDAIDAYTRAIQLDSNNAHIHRRLEEIKLHQETGAPLSAPPSPKDMSYTSANWPFPNALNGPSDVGFGHTSAQPHDESNRAPIIHSPNSPLNNLHTSSAGPLSPVGSSGRNIIRPDTSNSAIGMRPQSAGSFTHAPSSSLPHGNRHQPSHSGHPAPPPSHYVPSSSLTRRQSGGHGPLAPMEFEPSPRLPNRGHPSASQHNLPHIHAVVDSHSRGSSPTPTAPESVRRSQALPVSAPREIVSPHTSPSIRPNVAPNDRMHYCGQSIGPPGAISHLGPSSAYSRYPPSNPSMEDTIPSQSQHPGQLGGLLNRERVRDRPGRESARFRPHSPDSRAGRADRDARIPPTTNPSNNAHSHRSGDYGGAGFPVPPQAQRQLPYDNRQGSPGLRGPPTGPRPFSPENAHTPPWPGIDSRTGLQNPPSGGAGGVVSPELRRSGSRSSQSFPPGSNLPPSHQIPPPQHGPPSGRYDPRYDDSMIPGHRKSISAEQVSPQRPRSALQRSHEEIERQKALTVARQAQPSPTPSVAASEFSISGGNGANPSRRSARSKGISKEDEYPSGPAIRKRKAPASRLNVNNSNAVVPPVPSVNNSTSVSSIVAPVTSPSATAMNEGTQTQPISRDKKEKKKMANTKVRGVIKSKINDNSKGPSPSPAPPALSTELAPNQISQPTPGSGTSLPDRKVDEAFEEYDEVADTLLSFATQPSCRVLPSQQSSQDLSSHSAPPISKGSRVGISGSSKTGGSSRNGRNGNSAVSPESEKSSGGGAGGSRSGRSPSNSSHSMPARSIRGSPKRADSSPESTLTQPYLNQSSHYLQHSGNSISSNSIAVSPSVENHTGIVAPPPGLLTSGGSQFIASSYTASSAPVPKRLRSDGSSPSGWESGHDVKRSRASGQLSPLSVTNGETRSPHSTGGVSNIHGKTNMMSITGGRKGIMNDGYKKAREHRGNGSEQHQSSRRGKKGSDRPNPQRTVNEEEEDNKSAYDEGEEEFSKNRPSMDEDEGEEEEEAEDEVEEEEDEERDGQDVEMSTAT